MNLALLRTHREREEGQLQAELAQVAQALQETETARLRLEAEAEGKARAYLEVSRIGMTIGDATAYYAAMDSLATLIARTSRQEARLREKWHQKQTELLEAARERKKLDILVDRQRQKRLLQQERQAQRLSDETAGRRARSNGGSA